MDPERNIPTKTASTGDASSAAVKMRAHRTRTHSVARWVSRAVDAVWEAYYARRRVILAATAVVAVAAALWFIIPYAQGEYTTSKLQDALQRADGAVLLSMCFERERELLQVSPQQIHDLLQELYRLLQVKQVEVDIEKHHRQDIVYKVTFSLLHGGKMDLGQTGLILMVYHRGGYRLFSLSGFLYALAKRAVLTHNPTLQGETTSQKRAILQQTTRQFLQRYGVNGVFNFDLRNYPEVAWQVLRRPDDFYKLVDFRKHVSLRWPDE
jgi:hypothetical protein